MRNTRRLHFGTYSGDPDLVITYGKDGSLVSLGYLELVEDAKNVDGAYVVNYVPDRIETPIEMKELWND